MSLLFWFSRTPAPLHLPDTHIHKHIWAPHTILKLTLRCNNISVRVPLSSWEELPGKCKTQVTDHCFNTSTKRILNIHYFRLILSLIRPKQKFLGLMSAFVNGCFCIGKTLTSDLGPVTCVLYHKLS